MELQSEYNRLKQTLHHLNYNYPFGLDSVVLVQNLVKDLIRTTEAYKSLFDDSEKWLEQLQVAIDEKAANASEVKRFQVLLQELDRERDQLQNGLDEKV